MQSIDKIASQTIKEIHTLSFDPPIQIEEIKKSELTQFTEAKYLLRFILNKIKAKQE